MPAWSRERKGNTPRRKEELRDDVMGRSWTRNFVISVFVCFYILVPVHCHFKVSFFVNNLINLWPRVVAIGLG